MEDLRETVEVYERFRPLSWGLSFNMVEVDFKKMAVLFSSPFLGTFFQ